MSVGATEFHRRNRTRLATRTTWREVAFVIAATVHFATPVWLLSGEVSWTPLASLGAGIVVLVLALLVQGDSRRAAAGFESCGLRSPIVWLGAAFLAFVALQAANPRWVVIPVPGGYDLHPQPFVGWLPAGTRSNWAEGSTWRMVALYGAVWLGLLAIVIGVRRKGVLVALLTALCVNATAVGLVGLLERAAGKTALFALPGDERTSAWFASFPYRNHAAAFLVLWLGGALALAAYHRKRSVERVRHSGPEIVFILFALFLFLACVYSASRAGTTFCAALCAATLGWKLMHLIARGRSRGATAGGVIVAALLAAFGVFLVRVLDLPHVIERFRSLPGSSDEISSDVRFCADRAAVALLRESWPAGRGAGAFQYHFPAFQASEPRLARGLTVEHEGDVAGVRRARGIFVWKHAHNDYLQLPIELGLAGTVLLGGGLLFWVASLLRARCWRATPVVLLLGGLAANLLHAGVDYIFQNPAMLLSWGAVAALSARWAAIVARTPERSSSENWTSAMR